MCTLTPREKSLVNKALKDWRNHNVSASDWETQAELTQILDKLVGGNSTPVMEDD